MNSLPAKLVKRILSREEGENYYSLTLKYVIRFRCGCELEALWPLGDMHTDSLHCCKNHDGTVFSWFNNTAELEFRDVTIRLYFDGVEFDSGSKSWDHGDWSKKLWTRVKAIWRRRSG